MGFILEPTAGWELCKGASSKDISALFTPPDLQMPANVDGGALNGRCRCLLRALRNNQEAEEA
jgi:hypothetical protein